MAFIQTTPSAAQNAIQGSEKIKTVDFDSVAALATSVLIRRIADKRYVIKALRAIAGTFGANSTLVVNIEGVAVTGLSVVVSASNTMFSDGPTAETIIEPGQRYDIAITAGAGNANFVVQLILAEVVGV